MNNTDWYKKALETSTYQDNHKVPRCKQCKTFLNPVEVMLSGKHGVCGYCTRENHKEATNGKI